MKQNKNKSIFMRNNNFITNVNKNKKLILYFIKKPLMTCR